MSFDEIPPEIQALDESLRQIWLKLPPLVTREKFSETIGSIYSARHLANLDCQGRGPSRKVLVGTKVCYCRSAAVLWLAGQIKSL